ncbi:MAG: hypothetical protein Q8P18_32020 [Pseudomonadota bacterium]|nr:hypothetical protein [Pseudomonadota bacterium]
MISLLLLSVLHLACAVPDPCAGTRDLANSPAGLALTEPEHPSGWGSGECFQCHQRWSVHREDCIDDVAVGTIEAGGLETCAACHGANGAQSDTGGAR